MPGSLPASRPIIADAEVRNGVPALASLARKIVAWEQFTFCRDLPYLPASPHPSGSFAQVAAGTPEQATAPAGGRVDLGVFPVPDSLSFARRLRVDLLLRVSLSSPSRLGELVCTPAVGAAQRFDVYVSGTEGWSTFYVYARAGVPISLALHNLGLASLHVDSVCAWWEPLDGVRSDVTVEALASAHAMLATLENAGARHYEDGRPLSVYALRWLQRKAMQFEGHRPRVVAASATTSRRGSISGSQSLSLGRYRVPLSDVARRFTAAVRLMREGTAPTTEAVHLRIGGASYALGGVAATPFLGSGYDPVRDTPWQVASITDTVGATRAAQTVEVELSVVANSPGTTTYTLHAFSLFEDACDQITFPFGSGVPATFPSLSPSLAAADAAIYGDANAAGARIGIRALVEGMAYLIGTRGRCLVADSAPVARYVSVSGNPAPWVWAGWYKHTPSDGAPSLSGLSALRNGPALGSPYTPSPGVKVRSNQWGGTSPVVAEITASDPSAQWAAFGPWPGDVAGSGQPAGDGISWLYVEGVDDVSGGTSCYRMPLHLGAAVEGQILAVP